MITSDPVRECRFRDRARPGSREGDKVKEEGTYGLPSAQVLAAEAARLERQGALLWLRESQLLSQAGVLADSRALDVGCGPGRILMRFREFKPALTVGLDLNQGFLRSALTISPVTRGTATWLPFASDSFDVVYARFILRHIQEPDRVLEEVHRVLRTGGIFASLEPDESALELDPQPDGWPLLRAALNDTARRRSADPFVGRRVRRLCLQTGLRNARSQVVVWTTEDLGPEPFVEVLLAPSARPIDADLLDSSRAKAIWNSVTAWSKRDDAFGYGITVFTSAVKG